MALVSAHVEEDVLIRFAQKLACNEKKIRDRALNKLRKWIENRCKIETGGFTEDDLLKIWKGLHYCVWMSDKPIVQEDLTNNIASLIQCFSNTNMAMLFIKTFFKTISREWFGIDRLRLDKFMMLVRRCLASSFVLLKTCNWERTLVAQFMDVLRSCTLTSQADNIPDGLKFHIVDIFFDELKKVAAGKLGVEEVQSFLDPYCIMLAKTTNKSLFGHILKVVFYKTLREATEKPEGDEDIEDEEHSEDADNRLQFDFEAMHKRLFHLASSKRCVARNRVKIYGLVKRLRALCDEACVEANNSTSKLEMVLPHENGCVKEDALEETERIKRKSGKKKKMMSEQQREDEVTRENKSAKKRKRTSLENEENVTLCNGQQDVDEGQTKTKKHKKTPLKAAFLKQAISKVSPKTEPKKKRKNAYSLTTTSHSTGKKKVIFAMAKNTAQEFSDSLTSSPVPPFNPVQKPSQGILKSPASLAGSPATVPPTKLRFGSVRATAVDFF